MGCIGITALCIPSPWGPIPHPRAKNKWILAEIVPRKGESLKDTLLRGSQQGLDRWKNVIGDLSNCWDGSKEFWFAVLRPRSGPWETGEGVAILTRYPGSTVIKAYFGTFDSPVKDIPSNFYFRAYFPIEEFTEEVYTGFNGVSPIVKLE